LSEGVNMMEKMRCWKKKQPPQKIKKKGGTLEENI